MPTSREGREGPGCPGAGPGARLQGRQRGQARVQEDLAEGLGEERLRAVGVNLSAKQFSQIDLMEQVWDAIREDSGVS